MRCPGQDRRYWKDDAVFDVPCPKCGSAVEFFKDESGRRCSKCGHRFQNPKIALGCAEWCAYAEECVGTSPKRSRASEITEGAISARLIQAVKEECESDSARLTHALLAFQHAKELVGAEGGDPRITLAAALLLDVAQDQLAQTPPESPAQSGQPQCPPKAREILAQVGLDEETSRHVCRIIHAYRDGCELDTIEFQVVADSHALATLAAEDSGRKRDQSQAQIDRRLRTESARARSRNLFQV